MKDAEIANVNRSNGPRLFYKYNAIYPTQAYSNLDDYLHRYVTSGTCLVPGWVRNYDGFLI
uniref:Uncharacterized protein n=1 Tax=Rhizophora mucronata TaxID=61149 RepID=A0A2P2NN39_RHIMU